MKKDDDQDGQIEKELKHLKEEIEHEKEEIKHLGEELKHEQKELDHLTEELDELEQKNDHSHHHPKEKSIHLVFIVNGQPNKIEAKTDWPLKKAVEKALKDSGNEGRLITDWTVKWNNKALDISKEIKEFHFPECAELFLSLNAGQGGNY